MERNNNGMVIDQYNLHRHSQAMLAQLDQQRHLMMIDGGNETKELSVDLDRLTPEGVASVLRGINKDSFWSEVALEVVHNVAVVAQAYSRTLKGSWKIEHGEQPYSLAFIYEMSVDSVRLCEAILAIQDTLDNDYERIREYATPELFVAINFLGRHWIPMAYQTRDGIQANINQMLLPLLSNSNGAMRRGFAQYATGNI